MQLSPEALRQAQNCILLAEHHDALARTARLALEKVVADETGIDLVNGDWNLDPETGEITHVTTD